MLIMIFFLPLSFKFSKLFISALNLSVGDKSCLFAARPLDFFTCIGDLKLFNSVPKIMWFLKIYF